MPIGVKLNRLNSLMRENQVKYSQLNYRESPLGAINEEQNQPGWREKQKRDENLKRKHQRLQHLKGLATMNGRVRDPANTQELETELKQPGARPSEQEHFSLIKQIIQKITKGKLQHERSSGSLSLESRINNWSHAELTEFNLNCEQNQPLTKDDFISKNMVIPEKLKPINDIKILCRNLIKE